MTSGTGPSARIGALADELFAATTAASPLWATTFGAVGADHLLPDLSEEGQQAVATKLRDLADHAASIDPSDLAPVDRVTRCCLIHEAESVADGLTDDHAGMAVGGVWAPFAFAVRVLAKQAPGADLVERLRAMPRYLDQAGERAVASLAAGRGTSERAVAQAIEHLDAYLVLDLDDDPVMSNSRGSAVEQQVRGSLADEVRPAAQRYRDLLAGPVAAKARSDERAGLIHVVGGDGIYARTLAGHTTTTRTPEEIHQLGLDVCDRLRDEYADLGQRVFGVSDFDAITKRLRRDASLRYETPQQIVDDARRVMGRAEEVLPEIFGTTPLAQCEVVAMPDMEGPTSPVAYYVPAALDGSRPGRHWINTFQPHTRPRFEYEALAFHESVPGHHLQFAIGQELAADVPTFRRLGYVAAFSEGWGLYTERLCDEVGLYSSDLARFGILSFDSWRACRLVVDTGIHYFGWSRQRAIDFLAAHSVLTRENIVNEVDRYISWPGQACAYMVGRDEIDEARRSAEQALGPAFDIRDFHDAVLLNGSVPLTVLHDEVGRWVASPPDRASGAATHRHGIGARA